ncbi:MAG TPA: hypothetical protein VKX45_13770 [Bryobacteraceae bacterium]|jgi:hypothetical protein|nr:hypothetical protein [Bryobacteraceae bacterium]
MTHAKTQLVTVESPLHWILATAYHDPGFEDKLHAATPELEVRTALTTVLPYSVVVTNNGTVPVAAIAVRFSLGVGGRVVNRDFFYHSWGQPDHPVIPAGESRLFTPLKTANAIAGGIIGADKVTRAHPGTGGAISPLALPGEASALSMVAGADSIHISVDLVIAPDGRYAGPDSAATISKLNRQLEAYGTMRGDLLARLEHGESDQTVAEWLGSLAEQRVTQVPGSTIHHLTLSQRQYASTWLHVLKTGGRSGLQALLATSPEQALSYIVSLKGGLQ